MLYNQSPFDREFEIKLDSPVAYRVIELIGWILQNSPEISKNRLIEDVGKTLATELDIKPLAARTMAEKGLNFWKERRILDCLHAGHESKVNLGACHLCSE